MLGIGRNRGNYEYATTRAKVKKSHLLTKDNYPKLLLMDLNEISRFLGETQYKAEMAQLASRYSSVDLIEFGTSRNLARSYREILSFCTGDLREMVSAYLRRWDFWNLKTILRGKQSGASLEEIQEDLVAAGNYGEEYLNQLLNLDGPKEILDAINKKGDIVVRDDVVSTFEKGGNLAVVEDYLDKLYYERLLRTIQPGSKKEALFLSFIKKEIDVTNLRTLLKLKQARLPVDHITPYFIKGGRALDIAQLNRLASIDSFDSMVDDLAKLPFYESIKEELEQAKKSGTLSGVMLGLQRYIASEADKFSHMYPLSVLPVIDFILRKKVEVDNIRAIARGKQAGLDPEVIKKLLVM